MRPTPRNPTRSTMTSQADHFRTQPASDQTSSRAGVRRGDEAGAVDGTQADEQTGTIDKARARRAFGRAAARYDEYAVLQRELTQRMLERLDYVRIAPRTILDLGCGTGLALDALGRRFRRARLLALDFALPMLAHARRRGSWLHRPRPVCADLEALPLADASVDLVFSNATLQWANDPARAFTELRRVLRPGGLLLFTTFGPDTLIELRRAWAAADGGRAAHVSRFLDMHDIGDALLRARFADPVMDVERITVTYPDLHGLLRDLRAIGANNALVARPRGLTGRQVFAALTAAYETQRRDGRLPATWEVVHGQAWIGAGQTSDHGVQQAGPDGVMIPVSAIGRRRPA